MQEKKMSEALQKARDYEEKKVAEIKREQRPAFHACAPVGWINDPNGFSQFQGEYHLFYQYYPYATKWGPMHWGHSKTKDFLKWEQLPAALAPDTEYDGQGCFSGSAIEYDGKHVLMYTGVLEKEEPDGHRLIRQTQSIAIGDGINYEKLSCNPVITGDMLPEGSSKADFRDPKLWRDEEDGRFYAIAGSRGAEINGRLTLFSSADLQTWQYEGLVEQDRGEYGAMWECPDFFPLDGKQVILISPQEMEARGLEFHNGNGTVCMVGDYRKAGMEYTRDTAAAIDYGLDFYAPQTLETTDGRRVMIGWMQSWDNHLTPPEFKWSGIMTIPRELRVINNRLIQNPVRELADYYRNSVQYQNIALVGGGEELTLDGISGRSLDMTVEIKGTEESRLKMELASDGARKTMLIYDAKQQTLTFDRSYAGIKRDVIHQRTMKVEPKEGSLKVRIVMDKYTVEVFVNDGQQAMSSLIYTDMGAEGISFSAEEPVTLDITKHDIVME